jgi:hypothetical protein
MVPMAPSKSRMRDLRIWYIGCVDSEVIIKFFKSIISTKVSQLTDLAGKGLTGNEEISKLQFSFIGLFEKMHL